MIAGGWPAGGTPIVWKGRFCGKHTSPDECEALGRKLERSHETRRQVSIGLDTNIWMSAVRERSGAIPHAGFLERFERSGRWRDGSTPFFGLARAAVLYHLPSWTGRTLAEHFAETAAARALCPSEREWLVAEQRARLSFFRVKRSGFTGRIRIVDAFDRSAGEIGLGPRDYSPHRPVWRDTLFARVVCFRGDSYVDVMQLVTASGCGIHDPLSPLRQARTGGRKLAIREERVIALFEAWDLEADLYDGGDETEATHP